MVRTKLTAKRSYEKTCNLPGWMVNRHNGNKKKRIYPFKIKLTLPEQKTVNITVNIEKNGQVLKSINVRRKSKYFTDRNQLIFNSWNIFYLITIFNFLLPKIFLYFHHWKLSLGGCFIKVRNQTNIMKIWLSFHFHYISFSFCYFTRRCYLGDKW